MEKHTIKALILVLLLANVLLVEGAWAFFPSLRQRNAYLMRNSVSSHLSADSTVKDGTRTRPLVARRLSNKISQQVKIKLRPSLHRSTVPSERILRKTTRLNVPTKSKINNDQWADWEKDSDWNDYGDFGGDAGWGEKESSSRKPKKNEDKKNSHYRAGRNERPRGYPRRNISPSALPKSCACRRVRPRGRKGICYYYTNEAEGMCAKRDCAPSYVCTPGARAHLTCVLRITRKRIVSLGNGRCATGNLSGHLYVPYASSSS